MMLSARASLSTPLPSSRLAFLRRRRGVFVGDRGVDAPSVRTDSGEPGSGELGLAAPSWSEARISADNAALATVGRDGGKCAMRASSFTAHASHTRTGSLCPSLGNGLRFVEHWAQKMPPHLPRNPTTARQHAWASMGGDTANSKRHLPPAVVFVGEKHAPHDGARTLATYVRVGVPHPRNLALSRRVHAHRLREALWVEPDGTPAQFESPIEHTHGDHLCT